MTREQYLQQRAALMTNARAALDEQNLDEYNRLSNEVSALDARYDALSTAEANFAALGAGGIVPPAVQNLGAGLPGNPGASVQGNADAVDVFDTVEYRTAFMNFACRTEPIPAQFTNAATTTSTAPAVIPTTYHREIIHGLEDRGVIFQQLRHLNVQGGMEIPVVDLKPTAHWVGEEASEDQMIGAEEAISFKYHGLECKIAQSILMSVVSLEEFQALFVELAIEAIMAALEKAVFKGTGVRQMMGVCNDPRVTNVVTIPAADFGKWDVWKKTVFAKIPKKYQRGAFYMAQATFEGWIDGMVDQQGQPIGRTNYGIATSPTYSFGGKPVETTEADVLPPYDTAATDDVVAVYMNMKDYILNSNLVLTVVHWVDHGTNKKYVKVMMVVDGKAADVSGIILIKKGA